jgi:hypothetical protein
VPELVVDSRQIEVHFTCELGLEILDLEFDRDEAPKPQVVEQEVEVVVLPATLDVVLAADENETLA